MKYTEIDGKRYEIKSCDECPFRNMGDDGYGAYCTHPLVDNLAHDIMIGYGVIIAEECPLREV